MLKKIKLETQKFHKKKESRKRRKENSQFLHVPLARNQRVWFALSRREIFHFHPVFRVCQVNSLPAVGKLDLAQYFQSALDVIRQCGALSLMMHTCLFYNTTAFLYCESLAFCVELSGTTSHRVCVLAPRILNEDWRVGCGSGRHTHFCNQQQPPGADGAARSRACAANIRWTTSCLLFIFLLNEIHGVCLPRELVPFVSSETCVCVTFRHFVLLYLKGFRDT